MPLSTFSSNQRIRQNFPRPVWLRTWLLVMALVLVCLGGWESFWRMHGYIPTVEDDLGLWAAIRRQANQQEGESVALIGSSRIQLGLNPDVFARTTGVRPLMLAIDGNSPLPVLQNLAEDPKFSGLVICGLTPQWLAESKTSKRRAAKWIRKYRRQKWSSRLETQLSAGIQQLFVFRFPGLSPARVWRRLINNERLKKVYAPMRMDRYRSADYSRTDLSRLKEAREKRSRQLASTTISLAPEAFKERVEQVHRWVESIEHRGGQVVFIRMPSTGTIREIEEAAWPRHRYWDVFAARIHGLTIHFEDYAVLSSFPCPDGSHLDADGAILFSEALVKLFQDKKLLLGYALDSSDY
ncbi:MAG TPA: hypothetical protein EYP35_04040, partial [Desulfobacterales bacterium]|nr:hypothetical protein [Desulfobacterales bacterium]